MTTVTPDSVRLSELADKHVTVTYREDGENKTITGLVTKANIRGILVRPKGRPFVLIDAEDIASLEVIAAPAPKIKMRSMEQVSAETVRQHLADRHGMLLPSIPDDAEQALALHEGIDHSQLGHIHRPDAGELGERVTALDVATDEEEDLEED